MATVRLLPRAQWEMGLRAYDCSPLEGKGPLNTAEWWRAPWGFLFTVPVEGPESHCEEQAFNRLLIHIQQSRPPDWPGLGG